MSPEKQRIAIAEACGWKCRASTNKDFEFVWMHKDEGYCYALPDYAEDLNAMHEAERVALNSAELLSEYADQLDKVCVPTHICCLTHWQSVVMATAAQRAEAFLKAIGKWEFPPTPKQEAGK
jgi:hypothetical protein